MVRSAEEAVRVIREKLGEDARVLSVKQVGGEGLKRFISSPKLEVIAEVPGPESTPEEADAIAALDSVPESGAEESVPADEAVPGDPADPRKLEEASYADGSQSETEVAGETARILSKTGFDAALLSEIKSWSNWQSVSEMPLADALKEITIGLSDRFRSTQVVPTTDRIALIGAPGVGKTTTLCKFLAHEVFMNKRTPLRAQGRERYSQPRRRPADLLRSGWCHAFP